MHVLRPQDNWAEISEVEAARLNVENGDGDGELYAKEILAKAKGYRDDQLKKDEEARRQERGSRRLCDMALSIVSTQIHTITPFDLDALPVRILLSLWRQINRE